jgi:hypothetical protein
LTYKFSSRTSLHRCFQYLEINRVFSYFGTHIKVYRYWLFGVVNLCPANKLPSAGEASDLSALLLRVINGVKIDILTIMRAHWVGSMVVSACPDHCASTRIISIENQSFGNITSHSGSMHKWVTIQGLGGPRQRVDQD